MNSVPFFFCDDVCRQLKSLDEPLDLGGRWKCAASEHRERRHDVLFAVGATNHPTKCKYVFDYYGPITFKEFQQLDSRYVRITEISYGGYRIRSWTEIDVAELGRTIIPFIVPFISEKSHFTFSSRDGMNSVHEGILTELGNYCRFEKVGIFEHCSVTETFLKKQVTAQKITDLWLGEQRCMTNLRLILNNMENLTYITVIFDYLDQQTELMEHLLARWRRGDFLGKFVSIMLRKSNLSDLPRPKIHSDETLSQTQEKWNIIHATRGFFDVSSQADLHIRIALTLF